MDIIPTFRIYAQEWYCEAIAGVCYVQSRAIQNAINNLNYFIGSKLLICSRTHTYIPNNTENM